MTEHQDVVLAEILLELKALRSTVVIVGGVIVNALKLQEINPELPYTIGGKPYKSWDELSELISSIMRETNQETM